MSIALIVTRGFGNGTLVGTIKDVVTRGYTIGVVVVTPFSTFGVVSLIDDSGAGLSSSIDITGQGVVSLIGDTFGVVSLIDSLVDRKDVIVYDSDSHACIVDGVRLHLGKRFVYVHNDMANLEKQLAPREREGVRCCRSKSGAKRRGRRRRY